MSEIHQLEIDGHIMWLAGQARIFGDAKTAEQLKAACLLCPGTQITEATDPDTPDGYHDIINAAAGQMQSICDALATFILGPVQS